MNSFAIGLTALATSTVAMMATAPAMARPAVLTAQDADAQINVRAEPSTESMILGYGAPGEAVEVIRTLGVGSYPWHYVSLPSRYDQPSIRGWVRADFVQLSANLPAARWSKTYRCGEYTVMLRQVGNEFTFDQSNSQSATSLYLEEGYRSNTGSAWKYRFYSVNNEIWFLTDAWGKAPGDTGTAMLTLERFASRDARSPQLVLQRSCSK
jgi:hypothetical protein